MAFVPLKRKVVEEKEEDNFLEEGADLLVYFENLTQKALFCRTSCPCAVAHWIWDVERGTHPAHVRIPLRTKECHQQPDALIAPLVLQSSQPQGATVGMSKVGYSFWKYGLFCSQRKRSCVTEDVALAPLKLAQKSRESHPSERECSFVLLPCGLGTHLCLVAGPGAKYEVSRDRFGRGNLLSRRIEEGLKASESCNCFATLTIFGTKLTIIDWGLRIVDLLTTDDCQKYRLFFCVLAPFVQHDYCGWWLNMWICAGTSDY